MDILEIITDEKEKKIYEKYASKPLFFHVIDFAKELGIVVKESDELPSKTSGFIKKTEKGIFICVNSKNHENTKRFTVAHELGHYFLHRGELQNGIVDGIELKMEEGKEDPKEDEANKFAANLLMPKELFKQLWDKEDYSIGSIAERFFVSESAVITRAKDLKLVKDYQVYFA